MTRLTSENVLATIREHGPLTKTEVAYRLYGKGCSASERIENILDELKASKRITLTVGQSKNSRRQRCWVYSVTP